MHRYCAYGLDLACDVVLPELPPLESPFGAPPDIEMRIGPEAGAQARLIAEGGFDFVAAPGGGQVLCIPEVGSYWVRGGCAICVTPAAGADDALVRLFLIGSALGMALHQRGLLVLHGATVLHAGWATLIVGAQGAGKSTLAAALNRRGHEILGDDVMVVRPGEGGLAPAVSPGARTIRLWRRSIEVLGIAQDGLTPIANRMDKFHVPCIRAASGPSPLREILLLEAGAEDALRRERLTGLDALAVLAEHSYRPTYIDLLGRRAAHFRQIGALASAVAVGRLVRPWDLDRLDDAVAVLEAHWNAKGPAD